MSENYLDFTYTGYKKIIISWHNLHSEAPFILGVEVELVDK